MGTKFCRLIKSCIFNEFMTSWFCQSLLTTQHKISSALSIYIRGLPESLYSMNNQSVIALVKAFAVHVTENIKIDRLFSIVSI